MFIQTLSRTIKLRTGWRYRWFGNFFNGLAKSPRALRSSWIMNEYNLSCKIVKYCILSDVCMMKTMPHSTVSPQMWCINVIKGWFTSTQICWQEYVCKVNLSKAKKISLIFSPGLINPLWSLKCDRRWLLFFRGYIWGYQLDVRFGSLLGCLQIIFLKNHLQ